MNKLPLLADTSPSMYPTESNTLNEMQFPAKSTWRLRLTIFIACLGLLQFGYHMGELNSISHLITCQEAPIDTILNDYNDSPFAKLNLPICIPMNVEQFSFVTSIFSIGGLVGSLFSGSLANGYGRKNAAMTYSVFYIAGLLVTTFCVNYHMLLFGRFLNGLAAGLALVVTPLVISEVSPTAIRGFYGAMNQVLINGGIFVVLFFGAFSQTPQVWRFPLVGGTLWGILCLILHFYSDELPVWLMRKGRQEEAYRVLHKFRGGDFSVLVHEARLWHESSATSQDLVSLLKYLVLPEFSNSRLVVTVILVLQQFCGINSIVFYGTMILTDSFPHSAAPINCFLQVLNLAVTFFTASVIDHVGRRTLLKTSSLLLTKSTILIGWAVIRGNLQLLLCALFLYVISFAIGLGPIPFLLVCEVTQQNAQDVAQSWGITMNWLATFVVGYYFPQFSQAMGGGVFFIFTSFCVVTFMFLSHIVPETMGRLTYNEVWGRLAE